MFIIREIQEHFIYTAVKNESNEDIALQTVYNLQEDNPTWVKNTMKRLETKTWCQCTTGYSKVLFEKAFGCEVDVELLKSVKAGDEICLIK